MLSDSNPKIRRDRAGKVKQILHIQRPYTDKSIDDPDALVQSYLEEASELLEIPSNIVRKSGADVTSDDSVLRMDEHKKTDTSSIYLYQHYAQGLPVWDAGVTVTCDNQPLRIRSSYNSYRYDLKIGKLNGEEKIPPQKVDVEFLKEFLLEQGLKRAAGNPFLKEIAEMARKRFNVYKVTQARPILYRYTKKDRIHPEQMGPHESIEGLKFDKFDIPLDPVPQEIEENVHYKVVDILFTAGIDDYIEPYNFRIFVEPHTGAILYARILIAHINGYVYLQDPDTKGSTGLGGSTPAATLDPLRDDVVLEGLNPPTAGNYSLVGEYIELEDISDPNVVAPTSSTDFYYSVPSDEFSAVNAYYLSDKLFRMLSSYDINISTFFDGTSFPVRVDHRASIGCTCNNGNCKNASAPGNASSNGSDGFRYALVEANTPVGIATAWRVVLHEFGHACLWDNVNSPNFGFCHSMGDSLAVILNDPGTGAADRFESFPWSGIGRRHDRAIGSGWAYDGSEDDGGYGTEQILSTTLFRLYQMTGGDYLGYSADQEFAAKWIVKTILQTVSELTPVSNPNNADELSDAMQSSEIGITTPFLGIPGGHLHKVIRWSFEKQGAYLPAPPASPGTNTSEGDPESVDVYIDDGRNGEYSPMLWNFWNTTDIWNRLMPDGLSGHQTPIVGVTNHLYVKVKNRGTQNATNIVVRGFQCVPGSGLVWPTDWTPLATASINVPGNLAPGASVDVGPFNWIPTTVDHDCLLVMVDATDDAANDSTVTGPIPHFRLVPFDNNIAQRNVAPVAGGGSGSGLVGSFVDRTFLVRNPFDRAVDVRFEIQQHELLEKVGFRLGIKGVDIQDGFKLESRDSRKVVIDVLQRPEEFTNDEVASQNEPVRVEVRVFTDGLLTGGMTYELDPNLKDDPRKARPPKPEEEKDPCKKKGFWNWILCLFRRLFGGK